MKLTSPLYSLKAWKGISASACSVVYHVEGSGIFRRRSSYTILEAWYTPTNPRTSLQQSGRSMFSLALSTWHELPAEEKASWDYYQDKRRKRPVMSGYNLFISKFLLTSGNPVLPSFDGLKEK